MLGDKEVAATIAVKDMDVAKKFYEDTLGLTKTDGDDPGGILYKSGNTSVFVYQSEFAGTNKATAASWGVGDDIESIIKDLEGKGVEFETYEFPDVKHEGPVHVMGDMKAAWFKDPDGNILNIVNKM